MKKILIIAGLAIITLIVILSQTHTNFASPAESSNSNAVLGVEKFMNSVDHYRGNVWLEGVVVSISATNQMLGLIDRREYQMCGLEGCALSLPVRWTGTMPAVGQVIRVNGKVLEAQGKLVFVAKTVETVELPKK